MDKRREPDNVAEKILIMLCKVMQGYYSEPRLVYWIVISITLHNYLLCIMGKNYGDG